MAESRQAAVNGGSAGPKVVIIGAGVAGILMGLKLRERGWRDFVILEKADRLGGTWRDNVYPGIACDVFAHLYIYSFAPNPGWRNRFADGPEIWKYYHGVARRYGVLPHIRYGKEVATAEFKGNGWRVTTKDGDVHEADVVISGCGRLHHPVMPDIPGRDSFTGPSFHTARWDNSVELKGKRIGLIGTGSSATQITAAIADKVGKLKLFQRTPQWVWPMDNAPIPGWKRLAYRLFPALVRKHYRDLEAMFDKMVRAIADPVVRDQRDQSIRDALQRIRDPELRAKLTPDYEVGCKRLVISGTYHEAVQRPTVELVTEKIERIEPKGVVTSDGTLHELDVLAFATGFNAHAFLRPMQITGEGGVTLEELWADLPVSYRSVALPHMPNFFMMNGPYSPGGSASVVSIIETHVAYLMQLLERIDREKIMLAPREEAAWAWFNDTRERSRASVWGTGGCQSWYLDKTGTPALDPITLPELKENLAAPRYEDFEVRPVQQPAMGEAA
jgi:cation diffusion facilitator CzcD-associated flavoprotein CzcO